jgi:hypothetical protein
MDIITGGLWRAWSMIRKKPAPHLMRGGYRFSEKIMLKKQGSGLKSFQKIMRRSAR